MDSSLNMLRAIAEPMRWQIVQLLSREQLCVCHLVDELGVTQPLVSHHLRALREAGLVETERYRYWTYYRLKPDSMRALADELTRIGNAAPVEGDVRRPCC